MLKITGRDVDENEYGIKIAQPHGWTLISDSLKEAARAARTMIATTNLGDRSAEVIMLAGFKPDGIRAADVVAATGMNLNEASTYLASVTLF